MTLHLQSNRNASHSQQSITPVVFIPIRIHVPALSSLLRGGPHDDLAVIGTSVQLLQGQNRTLLLLHLVSMPSLHRLSLFAGLRSHNRLDRVGGGPAGWGCSSRR